MSEQQHKSTRKASEPEAQVDTTEVDAERKEKLDDDVDSILDEIDDVLEENAEEFVRSFVQKGGQ
ncbi:ubiquitin [Aeromicrobium sp. Root236]|jgi:ubiquitin-like protein Pup|uniref:ubiquitin-like protein Pup n=1 Tax=Aeromicrobium sp. Root236 TaxID=1736498 RepID=UPI0007012DC3|nr:ubiquitin-like protein Pup [Aeromicrobium sp. Root236]KRC63727.1 ubiquitin [Aeromicrobium sp. Root236]